MQKNFGLTYLLLLTIYFFACHSPGQGSAQKTDSMDNKSVLIDPTGNIPEYRKDIKKEPIAEYKEKTDDPFNDWYFSVRLYETSETFNYLIKLQFEEIRGEDTLKLPNLGTEPKPVLQKGKEKYSCIIGFMDNENKFREYKLVYVKGGRQLKVTALKHYGVSVYPEKP